VNRRRAILFLCLSALALTPPLVGAAQQSLAAQKAIIAARYPQVRWVATSALARWMGRAGNGGPILLDAREPEEFAVSHIRGARLVDPDLEDMRSLGIDRGERIVVYCSVGWRSGAFADRLREAGFRRVYNLEGGIFRWANEGRTLYRAGHVVRKVHPYDGTWGLMLEPEHRASVD
jgi:rhodanese-related sulfurtransferase